MIAEKPLKELIEKLNKEVGNISEKNHPFKIPVKYFISLTLLLITTIYVMWFTWLRYKAVSQDDGAIINYIYGNISKSPEQWGQFGDFIGGVLNSTFSSITLLLSFAMMRDSQRNHRQTMELQVLLAKIQKDEIDFNRKQSEKGQAGILSHYKSKIKFGIDKAERFLEVSNSDEIRKDTIFAYIGIFIESIKIAHEQRIYEIISSTLHSEVCELISLEVEFNFLQKKMNRDKKTSYKRGDIYSLLRAIDAYKIKTKKLLSALESTPI